MSGVQHIEDIRAIFQPGGRIGLKAVTDTFFQDLDADFGDFHDHILVSTFTFDENWPTWEIHPEGDELVLLLSGDTDMVLHQADGAEQILRVRQPGEYIVVPGGTWHTSRPHTPTTLLFLTPGEGTINALSPGGEPV